MHNKIFNWSVDLYCDQDFLICGWYMFFFAWPFNGCWRNGSAVTDAAHLLRQASANFCHWGFIQLSLCCLGLHNTNLSTQKMSSQIRQNFHQECEAAINRQINLELYASYVYLSMAYYFERDDKSLPNFANFFGKQSKEEREHAEKLMDLQNKRGGRIFLQDIRKPDRDEWGSGLEALECALQLEKSVNQSLLDLQKMASEHNDPHLCDFIETHFLDEQVKSIKQLADWISNLRRMGSPQNGLAEYLFDKHTMAEENS